MSLLIHESDARVPALRSKLNSFYESTRDYGAFQSQSGTSHFWPFMIPTIEAVCGQRGKCRILEFGAGRTGFARDLVVKRNLRESFELSTHDVTSQNRDWLEQEAERVFFGSVLEITGEYDIVFSTFVLEHMTDPERGLTHLWSLVASKGSFFVTCPRYDAPFYLPPSCDHLSLPNRIALGAKLAGLRLRTLLTGNPAFLLLDDLALFHLPWARDRDAVHLVSYYDLRAFFRRLGGRVKRGRNIFGGGVWDLLSVGGIKDWIVKRYLTVCLRVDR